MSDFIIIQEPVAPKVIQVGIQGPPGTGGGGTPGGLTGEVLTKQSNTSGDVIWQRVGLTPDLTKLGLEKAYDYAFEHFYTEFSYSLGVLTSIQIYTTPAMTTQLFSKSFSYSLGVLTTIVITRISDSSTLTKTFGYTLGTLTSITRT